MRVSGAGIRYGKDERNFTPWFDPSFQPGRAIRALGWAAFGGAAIIGSVPGVVATTLAMEFLRSSRPAGASSSEVDAADAVEC